MSSRPQKALTLRAYIEGHQAMKKSQSSGQICSFSSKNNKVSTEKLSEEIVEKFIEIKQSLSNSCFEKEKMICLVADLENIVKHVVNKLK